MQEDLNARFVSTPCKTRCGCRSRVQKALWEETKKGLFEPRGLENLPTGPLLACCLIPTALEATSDPSQT